MIIYNKLVRDKIPHIIETKGKKAEVRVLDEFEYKKMLDSKLQEEMNEYLTTIEEEQVSRVNFTINGYYSD